MYSSEHRLIAHFGVWTEVQRCAVDLPRLRSYSSEFEPGSKSKSEQVAVRVSDPEGQLGSRVSLPDLGSF